MKGQDHILARIIDNGTGHPPLMTQKELDCLLAQIKPEMKVIVELGCYAGGATVAMANKVAEDAKIYAVDVFAINGSHIREMTVERFKKYPSITLLEQTTNQASAEFFQPIDFLFIDADHQDDSIQADLKNWLPKVKVGGIVAFHDYFNDDFPSVQRRVEEFTQTWQYVEEADTLLIKRKP